MYSPRAGNAADARESEVSYWRLLGLQAVSFYAFLAIAIAAGMITIGDQAFYSALTTMTAIFASNLLYMPQSRQSSFEHCRIKRKRLSNAAYRFSGQWSRIRRRQARLQRFCTASRALEAISIWIHRQSGNIAEARAESRTYEGRTGSEVWGGGSFWGIPKFSQRCRHARRGPRFHSRSCSIRSPLTFGKPGDIAMRGSFILLGQAAVRWHVVAFHFAPAVSLFIAQLLLYCFIGAIYDTAKIICSLSRLVELEAALIHLAARSLVCKSWQFGGSVPCRVAGYIPQIVEHSTIDTRAVRIFWGKQCTGILRKCRGSGFRNIFMCIFVLFLLGGFLLEGNPPRKGLAAPPFHAGGGDQPAQRYSERLARNNSGGSTFLRSIQPDVPRSYVPRWPTDKNSESSATVQNFSLADPESPSPNSPEVDVVEAEVLDGSCDVLNLMQAIDRDEADAENSGVALNFALEGARVGLERQATLDIETTEAHLEFSAPASEVDDGPTGKSVTPLLAEEVLSLIRPQASPKARAQIQSASAKSKATPKLKWVPKAKAKSGAALKWVPKGTASAPNRGIADAWASLDSITLKDEYKHACATVREVPEFFSRQFQEAFYIATSRIRTMHSQKKELELERAWKLFLLLPRMLLTRTRMKGEDGKNEFFYRIREFHRGDWLTLVQQARLPKRKKTAQRAGLDVDAKLRAAEQRARWGELSHARQELVGTPLAPRTMETYYKLCDPAGRPQQPRSLERLQQVCQFQPESAVELDYYRFISNVRSAPRGKSGGLSGMRNEHLKCLVFSPRLEDAKALYYVAETLARAEIPESIRKGLALARMTALDKGAEKVRGIAAGDTFRRVVAKTLAQQYAHEFDEACSPYQFALSTRAGTDCVGHALREISNQHPGKVIISLDGIGAYDHIDRAQMLESLVKLPNACSLLPFVAMFYGHTSEYYWTNEEGEVWSIEQCDGGEQGDPLMPALFALGQHPALVTADEKLQQLAVGTDAWLEEDYIRPLLFAFLDDLYVVTVRAMARQAFDVVTEEVANQAGIRTNLGKLQLYSKEGGACPPGFEDFQALRAENTTPIWTCDAQNIKHRGIVVLGSPLGTVEFIKAHAEKRMNIEQQFLDWIPRVPTLQIAWLLLYYCAAQRANHLIRLLPPSLSVEYAEKHDRAILQCLEALIQAGPLPENAKRIASLRCVNGGLGLRSARRTAQAAFWAAWADALPMLHRRVPQHASQWSEALEFAQANVAHVEFLKQLPSGLQEAELARRQLLAEGFRDCPTWEDIREGVLPKNPDPSDRAPGEWSRGWQFYASRVRDSHYLEFEVRPHLSPSERALLLSQGGPFASQFLQALPTKLQLVFENLHLQCLLRRRLRLPLMDGLSCCPAHSHGTGNKYSTVKVALDVFGDHLTSCMRTGRVQRRANILEKIWMQIFQEAGGTIVPNEKLRHMRIGVDPEDRRRVEFAVYNLKFGPPLLCDATQVSALAQDGTPHPKCEVEAGAALVIAENRKTSTYREAAVAAGQVQLETFACEVGGRWSQNCITWVEKLAKYKASEELPHLRRASEFAWHSRWWSLLSVAAQRAFALSLIEVDCDAIKPLADFEPKVGEILADVRYEHGPADSRLPLRG